MRRQIHDAVIEFGAWAIIAGIATLVLQALRLLPAVWLPL